MEELKIREKLVTREELYKQVWETPMSRLGKEYGLTDNGLRKSVIVSMCHTHRAAIGQRKLLVRKS